MITKIVQRHKAHYENGKPVTVQAGTPVRLIDFSTRSAGNAGTNNPVETVIVELPDGKEIYIRADCVGGFEPEESLQVLAEATGVEYDTLRRAAWDGRLLARKSGDIWLSTRTAVEYAIDEGRIRN